MKRLMIVVLAAMLAVMPVLADDAQYASFKGQKFSVDAEYINLGKTRVKSEDMAEFTAFLKKMPNLKKVDMFEQPIGRTRRETLQEAFPDIEFGMTMIIGGEHYLRTDATAFSTLHGFPGQIWHKSDDFSALKYCKNLYALDLGHNYIDDLSFLYDLPKLRVLILAKNEITDISYRKPEGPGIPGDLRERRVGHLGAGDPAAPGGPEYYQEPRGGPESAEGYPVASAGMGVQV